MVLDRQRVEVLLETGPLVVLAGLVTGQVLVDDALVPPGEIAADQALDAVLRRALVAQHVRLRRERGQRPATAQDVVGVEEEQVVGLAPGMRDVEAAVVAEVGPGFLVEFSWDLAQSTSDELLGAVGGSGVGDDPGVDEVPYRVEAALDDGGFVLHDHAEANGRLHGR